MNHCNNFNHARWGRRAAGSGRQHGLTLIEFLIAIGLGLMIVAALTLLIAQQSATQSEFEKSSRQIENGRYAMQILSDDVQLAGFYGEFSDTSALAAPVAVSDPCLSPVLPANVENDMPFAVVGFDSPSDTTGISCINSANHKPGTDILVVRRADVEEVAKAAAVAGQVYMQSGLVPPSGVTFEKRVGSGSDTSVFVLKKKDLVTDAPLHKFLVRIYYLSPCSVPVGATCTAAADGGNPIPTLKMTEMTTSGGVTSFTTVPLVEGIENFQVDYGFDSVAPADGAPDGPFVSTAPAVASWADLVAIRVHILVRNLETSPGHNDTKTYAMGYMNGASAQTVTPAAGTLGYKRRLFSQLIRLVNPSARRDK